MLVVVIVIIITGTMSAPLVASITAKVESKVVLAAACPHDARSLGIVYVRLSAIVDVLSMGVPIKLRTAMINGEGEIAMEKPNHCIASHRIAPHRIALHYITLHRWLAGLRLLHLNEAL